MSQVEESYHKFASSQNPSKAKIGKRTKTDLETSVKPSCQKTWQGTAENSQQAKAGSETKLLIEGGKKKKKKRKKREANYRIL